LNLSKLETVFTSHTKRMEQVSNPAVLWLIAFTQLLCVDMAFLWLAQLRACACLLPYRTMRLYCVTASQCV